MIKMWNEVRPLTTRQIMVDGVRIQPLGLARGRGDQLFLFALEYAGEKGIRRQSLLKTVQQAKMRGRCFHKGSASSDSLSSPYGQQILALFREQGAAIVPGLRDKSPEDILLTDVLFEESCPTLDWVRPQMNVQLYLQKRRVLPVERTYTLKMGQRRRLAYTIPSTGEERSFAVTGLMWYDPWPKWQLLLANEALCRRSGIDEPFLQQICPPGLGLAVLHYVSKRGELSFQDTTSVGILYDQTLSEKREDAAKGVVLETPILPQTAKVSVTLNTVTDHLPGGVVEL